MNIRLKQLLGFIVAPIVAVLGLIVYLFRANDKLKRESARREAENDILLNTVKLEEAKNEANKAENDYNATRDAYKREHGDS